MKLDLSFIREYMRINLIDNNLDTDHPINSLGIYKIDKTNSKKWIVHIKLDENSNSMFRNGYFKITIEFGDDFPQKKLECRIINKIYHLNINPNNGHICSIFLNRWDSTTTISELLVGLYLVFIYEQNPNDPYSAAMSRQYQQKYNEFVSIARKWVIKYASPSIEDLNLVKKLFNTNENKEDEKIINELKDKLNRANKIIETQKMEIQNLTNQINSFKNIDEQLTIFRNEIKNRDEKIFQLLQKLQNNNLTNNNIDIQKKQIALKDMRCVTFITQDGSLVYGISCSGKDVFAEIEEKLYKEYPEYRETNNRFLANGSEVLRFKTINENKIGSGKPIMLIKPF